MEKDTAKRFVPKKELIPLLWLCATAVIVTIVVWTFLPSEPAYQGRNLTAWLADFEHDQVERQVAAVDAIKHIGPDAVPVLVKRLRDNPNDTKRFWRWERRVEEWLDKHTFIKVSPARPANLRHQALAGLDALGPVASNAVPALEKLLEENPPDPQALYVGAHIGPLGLPVLFRALTNSISSEGKLLRFQARVCLNMLKYHSETLFPSVEVGPDASLFDRRICEFNLKVMLAAAKDYRSEHPEMDLPELPLDTPSPSELP